MKTVDQRPPAEGSKSDPPSRVSNLELFFDLVFVYTVTQVTSVIDHRPNWGGAAEGFVVLVVLFWMYGGFAWLTNATGTGSVGRRAVMLVGMACLLICSIAAPHEFDKDGITFGIAYLALAVTHSVGFLAFGGPQNRRAIRHVGPLNIGCALLILASGWTTGTADWIIWTVVALTYLVALQVFGRGSGFTLTTAHFAERHSLMIIIVLGESLISVTTIAQGVPVDHRVVLGVLCGLAASAGLWWIYFDDDAAIVEHVIDQGRRSRWPFGPSYDMTHVIMMAGVIGIAAGTRLGYPDLLDHAGTPGAVLVAGGGAFFLTGTGWLRAAMGLPGAWLRIGAAATSLLCWPVAIAAGTAVGLLALTVVAAATVVVGHLAPAEPPTPVEPQTGQALVEDRDGQSSGFASRAPAPTDPAG